jgi:hypothetical protein
VYYKRWKPKEDMTMILDKIRDFLSAYGGKEGVSFTQEGEALEFKMKMGEKFRTGRVGLESSPYVDFVFELGSFDAEVLERLRSVRADITLRCFLNIEDGRVEICLMQTIVEKGLEDLLRELFVLFEYELREFDRMASALSGQYPEMMSEDSLLLLGTCAGHA